MTESSEQTGFTPINRAFNTVFQPNRLSLGLVVPLEHYPDGPVPALDEHLERVQLAEALGFAAVWLRDVPFNVPSFGDAGQTFDPFVYLGFLAGQTEQIALGVGSIILPLRHPAHVAKAAASIDVLSGGRLILGIASGDRPDEYPALAMSFEDRGERFRECYAYIRHMAEDRPVFNNQHGRLSGVIDMLPKPVNGRVPMLITGGSQQSPQWIAENGDGWITYPRNVQTQQQIIDGWRGRIQQAGLTDKPVSQSLYIDLTDNPDDEPRPIHLGFRSGTKALLTYLKSLEAIGVNHVAINLRFNQGDIETTLQRLANEIMPELL